MEESAAADPAGEWDLLSRMMEVHVRFHKNRNGGLRPSADYTAEQFSEDLLRFVDEADRRGFTLIKMRALYNAGNVLRIFARDYERAFRCYTILTPMLDGVSMREFLLRFYVYREIAEFCYSFREYDEAVSYYRRITEDPDAGDSYYRSRAFAWNGLGLRYRNGYGDLERADSCFRAILQLPERYAVVWDGIVTDNLGYNST
ncbi:MAG: hypothetical protein LBG19_05590 [Prevotellaceae bacterium]|jgi:tetratricopeptide (TPR) repeat protein|nr:hypothetical protein [Prevotellaceae bacterium]